MAVESHPEPSQAEPIKLILPAPGGTARVINAFPDQPDQNRLGLVAWSPDGTHLAWPAFPTRRTYLFEVGSGGNPVEVEYLGEPTQALNSTPDSTQLVWSTPSMLGAKLIAMNLTDPANAVAIGEGMDGINVQANGGPVHITADSSAVVWINKDPSTGLEGIQWILLADPTQTQVPSSISNLLDFDRIQMASVR